MPQLEKFIAELNVEFAGRPADDPLRLEYDKTVPTLLSMYERLERNEETLILLIDSLLDDYELQQDRITNHLLNKEFSGARSSVQALGSGIRQAMTPSKLRAVQDLEESAAKRDQMRSFQQWNDLHHQLYPMISVLRRYQSYVRANKPR